VLLAFRQGGWALCIIGGGYVGLAIVFANLRRRVIYADADAVRIARLNAKECSIHEPILRSRCRPNLVLPASLDSSLPRVLGASFGRIEPCRQGTSHSTLKLW